MAGNPKDSGADRGDAEEAPVTASEEPTPAPGAVTVLRRTVSSTQLLANEILGRLRERSSRPPKALTEEEEKKKDEEEKK